MIHKKSNQIIEQKQHNNNKNNPKSLKTIVFTSKIKKYVENSAPQKIHREVCPGLYIENWHRNADVTMNVHGNVNVHADVKVNVKANVNVNRQVHVNVNVDANVNVNVNVHVKVNVNGRPSGK